MIVDCAVYREGIRVHTTKDHHTLNDAVAMASGPGDFVWVGLREPSEHEFDSLSKAFNLHRLAIEDAIDPHQRPKIERYGDHVFFVLKTLSYEEEGDSVETGEIDAFLGSNYLITVRHGHSPPLEQIRREAEADPEVLRHGPAAALHSIVDSVVDQYESVASDLETDVDEVETSVFSNERTSDSVRIYRLKREVLEVRRATTPLREPLGRIVGGEVSYVKKEAMPFYRDIADNLSRVSESIDSIDSLLDNALNAHLAQLSLQQNDDMRKLAAYAAMFAGPTLIAGIYGMNFDHMPELQWRYGYGICLLVMVAVVFVLWRSFKRSGWL